MTAAPPRVSVICSVYNGERFLAETIESVLAQDFADYELLLVDDGSTDTSPMIARSYADRHPGTIRYLEHSQHENRGTTVSRNLAIREARGELLAFIDADDCWRHNKLKDQVAILDRLPEVDAACGAVNFWASHDGGEDRVIVTGHAPNRPVPPIEGLLKVYPIGRADPPCPSDLLMRRQIVERIGGFEESFVGPLQLYEDQAFLAKFFLKGTIFFSDQVWLDYRIHDQSCTSRVIRAGMAPAMRGHFLEWFEGYVAGTRYKHDPRVQLALARALRPYRHPQISKAGRWLKGLFRGARMERA